jgi:hypothetical protein
LAQVRAVSFDRYDPDLGNPHCEMGRPHLRALLPILNETGEIEYATVLAQPCVVISHIEAREAVSSEADTLVSPSDEDVPK